MNTYIYIYILYIIHVYTTIISYNLVILYCIISYSPGRAKRQGAGSSMDFQRLREDFLSATRAPVARVCT